MTRAGPEMMTGMILGALKGRHPPLLNSANNCQGLEWRLAHPHGLHLQWVRPGGESSAIFSKYLNLCWSVTELFILC